MPTPTMKASRKSYGKNRVVNQIMNRLLEEKEWEKLSIRRRSWSAPKIMACFLNEFTFEIDLFKAGAEDEFAEAINGLTDNKKMHKRFQGSVG